MAKNTSFKSFGSFSRIQNNAAALADAFDVTKLASTMQSEHETFVANKAAYEAWAQVTTLEQSTNTAFFLNNRIQPVKFSELFTVSDDGQGHPVVVFNPSGTNGSSWSKNTGGLVNALLTAFGTQRYDQSLTFHLHERKFDPSLVIEHNVRTAYDTVKNEYVRFDWNTRRFTQNTPWIKTSAGAGWLSKHVEIDRLILALVGGQQVRYTFFEEISWNRFQMNILDNMHSLISKVNDQLANQAEVAQTIRKANNDAAHASTLTIVTPNAVIVDGVDLRSLVGPVKLIIKMSYGQPVERTFNTQEPKDLAFIAGTMSSKKFESIKLVK